MYPPGSTLGAVDGRALLGLTEEGVFRVTAPQLLTRVVCTVLETDRQTGRQGDIVVEMLLHFSHIGFVFHSVYSLAILLFLSVIYASTFVLGSATSPVSTVVKM